MDKELKERISNQIFKFELELSDIGVQDSAYTLDFSRGKYRQSDLVGLVRDVAPFFALTDDELQDTDFSSRYKDAFTRISDAQPSKKGDYGELLLYVILSIFYDCPKFVTKARLRSSTGRQIEGFDCAHFTMVNDMVELWLGEAKFHKTFSGAVSKALSSLNDHLNDEKAIRDELKILGGNVEINKSLSPIEYENLVKYTRGGASIDSIPIKVPVLITYDSDHIISCDGKPTDITSTEFRKAMKAELEKHYNTIHSKNWPSYSNISLVFILMPFHSVESIKEELAAVELAMKF